jgi:multidrug transporter EmrE-like cation transporter
MSHGLTGIVVLIVAMMVESFAQLFLKIGAAGGPRILVGSWQRFVSRLPLASVPATWFALGIIAYVLEISLYTFALHFLDVSVAFPLGSLCFVGVALLSRVLLGEAVSRVRWLGIGLILFGTVFVTL